MISKQSLAVALSKLKVFEQPQMHLEQYATESELAAELIWYATMAGHLEGKKVLDLGAGTGILAIGVALMGANEVIAVEKDPAAIRTLKKNLEMYEGTEQIAIIESDVLHLRETADVVIMNPPFGTKEKHADRVFLERACASAPVIYTIHKTSTDGFVRAFAEDNGYRITLAEQRAFPIKKTMAHHEKPRRDADVTLYRLERT